MKIEIIDKIENPLLNRRELSFKIFHKSVTPSRNEVRNKLISVLNLKKETVILGSVKSKFGLKESLGIARVYKSEDRARQVESKFLIEKNFKEKKPNIKSSKKEASVEKKSPVKVESNKEKKPNIKSSKKEDSVEKKS
jgi:small subunit ribosomal protein S24e